MRNEKSNETIRMRIGLNAIDLRRYRNDRKKMYSERKRRKKRTKMEMMVRVRSSDARNFEVERTVALFFLRKFFLSFSNVSPRARPRARILRNSVSSAYTPCNVCTYTIRMYECTRARVKARMPLSLFFSFRLLSCALCASNDIPTKGF